MLVLQASMKNIVVGVEALQSRVGGILVICQSLPGLNKQVTKQPMGRG